MTTLKKFLKTPSGKISTLTALLFVSLLAYYLYAVSSGTVTTKVKEDVVLSISPEDHTRGGKAASVTLIEYGDFQCPACRAYETVVKELSEKYKDSLRVTFRHFPLIQIHKNAYLAASYTEAAGAQGKFWEMHDVLYEKQEEWGESLDAETKILSYAQNLGLDTDLLKKTASSKEVEERILVNYKEASTLKLPGTPSFFVNGVKIETNQLKIEVEKAIQASLLTK